MGLLLGVIAIPMTVATAGAATRPVSGTITGPGGYRSEGCNGLISQIGSGTYTSRGLGHGSYTFDLCVTSMSPVATTVEGTMTFTRTGGARITGTVDSTFPGGQPETFAVSITGGTRQYAHAHGQIVVGPLAATNQHNCGGVFCLDWTDTSQFSGMIQRGGHAG
jgi:hypothetical protein